MSSWRSKRGSAWPGITRTQEMQRELPELYVTPCVISRVHLKSNLRHYNSCIFLDLVFDPLDISHSLGCLVSIVGEPRLLGARIINNFTKQRDA